jgi:hypothetical protein
MKYSKLSNTSFTATMKHLLLMAFAILTIGCGEKKSEGVNLDEMEVREGVAYLKNSDSPYTGKFFEFHDNGQKKAETTLKDGKPDGLSEAWFENGQKKSEANYKDGKLHGPAVTWYENQPPFSPIRSGPKATSRPSRQKQFPSSQPPFSPIRSGPKATSRPSRQKQFPSSNATPFLPHPLRSKGDFKALTPKAIS